MTESNKLIQYEKNSPVLSVTSEPELLKYELAI